MKLSHHADFYMLEALTTAMAPKQNGDSRGLVYTNNHLSVAHMDDNRQRAYQRARYMQLALADDLALAVRDYLFLAASGEARHVSKSSHKVKIKQIPTGGYRTSVYQGAIGFDPHYSSPALIQVFNFQNWGGSYGGPKWGAIAQHAHNYANLKITPAMYVDYAADLEHNGGCVYNKESVKKVIDFQLDISTGAFKYLLDWKRDHDVLSYDAKSSAITFSTTVIELIRLYYAHWLRKSMPSFFYNRLRSDEPSYKQTAFGRRRYQLVAMDGSEYDEDEDYDEDYDEDEDEDEEDYELEPSFYPGKYISSAAKGTYATYTEGIQYEERKRDV